MTPNEYQEKAMRTNDNKNTERLSTFVYRSGTITEENPGDIINGCLGLAGETGEVVDLIKKNIFHGHMLDIKDLKYELGDCIWYIALICEAYGLTLNDVMNANYIKLKDRYPQGFSEQASRERKE